MITYKDIGFEDIHLVIHLWESNRAYHEMTSTYFSESYKGLVFEERMKHFSDYSPEDIRITLAYKEDTAIAYCLTIKQGHKGELGTLHVLASYRGLGIGKTMVADHLKWLRASGCTEIRVTVSQENEKTINFYKHFGFYPNTVAMYLK